MEHEMRDGRPKTWDKTKRFYEISFPNGKRNLEEYNCSGMSNKV